MKSTQSSSSQSMLAVGLRWGLPALAGLGLAFAAAAASPGDYGAGVLAYALLLVPLALALAAAWRFGGGGAHLAAVMALAFVLRLGLGLWLTNALPTQGYDQPVQRAGYLFTDAYRRDRGAAELAHSNQSILRGLQGGFDADQYGGLAVISALAYRYLSPDAHRSGLVLALGAFTAALGLPFLRRALRGRFSPRVGWLALWIVALYPDGVFFSLSQMREPFLIGLSAVALWAAFTWNEAPRWRTAQLGLALLLMAFFSTLVALAQATVMAVVVWAEGIAPRLKPGLRRAGWVLVGLGLLAGVGLLSGWMMEATGWDALVSTRASGWLARVLEPIDDNLDIFVVILYGLAQPVLPAAIAEPSIPLWKTLIIFRSAGWYALAPLLIYGALAVWRARHDRNRAALLTVTVASVIWLAIASARAGGDLTDNPRYRVLFLVELALMAAWAVDWALSRRDPWLWRWLAVEVIFLGFFTNWYFSRYFHTWARLPFFDMVGWIVGLSALVLVGGWAYDRWKNRAARQ